MLDNGMSRAQASYDAMEPDDGVRRCVCGCDYDDHLDKPYMDDVEDDIKAILEWAKVGLNMGRELDMNEALRHVVGISESRLSMCCDSTHYCDGFEPQSEDDLEYDED